MARVTGIGGVFFKSKNPKELTQWYKTHLGVPVDDYGYVSFPNPDMSEEGKNSATVWSPFKDTTDYFSPSNSDFMINFRVDNLEQLLVNLREAGVEVDDNTTNDEYGKFGWCLDPEGNKIELWETPAKH